MESKAKWEGEGDGEDSGFNAYVRNESALIVDDSYMKGVLVEILTELS